MKTSFADILEAGRKETLGKLAVKIPSWSGIEDLEIPSSINLEQCSSEAAARYKAAVAEEWLGSGEGCIADLTGGLGVDAWAFSQVFGSVSYNEIDSRLAASVQRNFGRLGSEVSCHSLDCRDFLKDAGDFDMIYADPARRSGTGKKVFLLEDCSPDILSLMEEIFRHSKRLMLKLSPMADISMLAERLGTRLEEVRVIGYGGECKELLCLLSGDHDGPYLIRPVSLDGKDCRATFSREEEALAPQCLVDDFPSEGGILLLPSPEIVKCGCPRLLCRDYGLKRLHRDIYVFLCGSKDACPLPGRRFRIIEIRPLGNASIKAFSAAYPRADVSARGVPLSSEELSRRLHCKAGEGIHIFAFPILGARYLIAAERIQDRS